MINYDIDNVSFSLKSEFDFRFIKDFGRVFCVFDCNDSGNISFGCERDGKRYFIKAAGAEPLYAGTQPGTAIEILKNSAKVYEELRHPALINLISHREIASGYICVFDWTQGECLGVRWNEKYPKSTGAISNYDMYRQLPVKKRLVSLDTIFEFHKFVASRGYAAIDFYDGSVMYDFMTDTVHICDIDLYSKMPYINTMGRMWGSGRFMSPEEFTLGAAIDEVSNVYTMGAAAFVFLGGIKDRSDALWEAGSALHKVACKAVNEKREDRYHSISEFIDAWNEAKTK